ncbi:hypothetical protein ACJ5H2_07225 [Nocardioides sp. R1-1]|uniref:hypothetical protein n=1 Tax=Nocardioides sp. R1-1 TaxID=3383502 RepID=UPI0038D20011
MSHRPSLRRRDDEGAILIIAIFVVAVVAVVTGVVLTRGDGSLRATVALRDVARSSYAADGAAQTAINALRTGHNVGSGEPDPWYYTNRVGTGCFGFDGSGGATTPKDTLTLDNLIPTQGGDTASVISAAVVCEPEDATGEQGSAVPINSSNKPGNAILTLGTGGETGFNFKTNGSGAAFRVKGGIWVNSDIVRDNNGNLESTESIRAHSGCTPAAAMVAPVVDCNAGTAADPAYQSDLVLAGSGIPSLQTPPATCPNNGSVQLEPGYYDDVTKLNALTNTNQQCFIHFKPGAYYFDFHNASGDALHDSDIAPNTGNVWTIGGRKTVVAGTLTSDTTVPGRCVNPIDDVNAQGVQFIFGGTSRLLIEANGQSTAVEICGSYHASRPPIAIYGQRTGSTPSPTVVDGANARTATSVPVPGSFAGATPAALQDAGGGEAVWTKVGPGSETSTMTVDGFAPATAIPKGAVLTAATLRIRHKEGAANSTASTVAFTSKDASGTTALATSYPLPVRTTMTEDQIVLASANSANWTALKRAVHDKGFTGATLAYRAALSSAAQTASVDSIRLELTYYVPDLRAQSGSVASPGGDPVIKVSGNSTTYYVQGTTYTPLALIDLALNNIDESVFRFGVVARSLKVFETGSFSYPGAVIELPDNSPGFGFERTIVRLKVYLCAGVSSGCTPGAGELALESRVELFDEGGTPGPPHREVTVLNWSHQR